MGLMINHVCVIEPVRPSDDDDDDDDDDNSD